MKTIFIIHNYTESTVASMSYYLAHYLSSRNYKVIFISHKPFFKESFEDKNVVVYSWPNGNRPTSLTAALWYSKLFFKYNPNLIICHFGGVNLSVILSKIFSLNKIKTFASYDTLSSQIELDSSRNKFFSMVLKFRKKIIYSFFCNQIICPSELAVNDLHSYFKIDKGIKILNPMVDRFKNEKYESNNIVISFLGRIDKSKGVLLLVDAFNEYCKINPLTILELKIAGCGSEEVVLLDKISKNDRIRYEGALSYEKVDGFLNNSNFTIVPSLSDNLPTVGIESLMNGVPLLISSNTGLTLELENEINCFVFKPELKELILIFKKIESKKYNYFILKERSREIYKLKFSLESYYKNIEDLITFK